MVETVPRHILLAPDLLDIFRAAGERWTDRGEPPGPAYVELIARARQSVLLLVVDPNRTLNEQSTIDVLAAKLEQGVSAQIILGNQTSNEVEDPEDLVRAQNPAVVELKATSPDRLRVFSLAQRPCYGFAVIDDEQTLLEEPQVPWPYLRVFIRRDYKWAREWKGHFEQLRDSAGQEILIVREQL